MRRRRLMAVVAAGATVGACDLPTRLGSLPQKLRGQAVFHGLPAETRVVLDGSDDAEMGRIGAEALRRELTYARRGGARPDLETANYLAISGGGENGAYGAGLLTAWTETGTRPVFKAVTGVSTGALIAPFAFLGSRYDKELERFYTGINRADVMASRGLMAALLSDSLYDSAPLLRTIRSALTPEMIAAIAVEHVEKGRLLCVATTNLDVPVGVLWNIGAIAAQGGAQGAELISRILLASASIPGVFPPVMINIDAEGSQYQEMHVDGGTVAQVVLYPPSISIASMAEGADAGLLDALARRKRRLFVIRNAKPAPDLETVDRSTLKIAGRALSTLIGTQGLGDLYQLFVIARRDGIDYNVATIPDSFTEKLKDPFDQRYMRALYRVGRETMLAGAAWSKYPPGFNPQRLGQRVRT